jgi:hypothetical protein
LANYLITWVDYATDQYLSLDPDLRKKLNQQLDQLAQDPTRDASYDRDTDRWSVEFDAGQGLIIYIANHQHRRIVILRILHLG